jgi:DNA polymerase I
MMNELLYGSNPEENIVAVHPASDRSMRIYKRIGNNIVSEDADFYPFFFISNSVYLKNFPHKHWIKELKGENYYRYLAAFSSWSEMWNGIHYVLNKYNENAPSKISNYYELPVIHVRTDPVAQFLKQTGRTLFKGMQFSDLHRLQIDIQTYIKRGNKTGNPIRLEDRILVIALKDNLGFEKILNCRRKSEKDILSEFTKIVCKLDPDIIEGYDIFNYILPYISARCELHNIEFSIGRDASLPRFLENRFSSHERVAEYFSVEIHGRHVIDIMHLVQFHADWRKSLSDYSLKSISLYLDISSVGRTYLNPLQASVIWETDPDKIIDNCKNNIEEIDKISSLLSPKVFFLSQIVPFNYDTVARTNISTKIESIILREYIRQKHSIPRTSSGSTTVKNYEEVFYQGIFEPVICLNIEPIYPNLMLNDNLNLKHDDLAVFRTLLNALFTIKKDLKNDLSKTKNDYYSLIISLINTFYEYTGNPRALFSDFSAHDATTNKSSKLIQELINIIKNREGIPVMIDSEKAYIVPPHFVRSLEEETLFVGELSKELGCEICMDIENRFKRIFSYKKRNYALISYNGKIVLKGSAFISRNIEPLGRHFIKQVVDALLQNDIRRVHTIYCEFKNRILQHKMSIRLLAKTEILRETVDEYNSLIKSGKRNRATGYEVALSSGLNWKSGDVISYYVSLTEESKKENDKFKLIEEWDSNSPDEDVDYYLKRLNELAKRFEILFKEEDYQKIFSESDLFGFSPDDIKLQSLAIESEISTVSEEEPDPQFIEPRILLDEELS